MDLTLQEALGPAEGHETWDYFVYGLLFLGLVTLFLMGSKSTQGETSMVALFVFICVLDKVYAMGYMTDLEGIPNPTREQRVEEHITHFATYVMRLALVVAPLMAAAMTETGRVRILTGILALAGLVYSFGRWYFEQRESGTGITYLISEPQVVAQSSLFLLASGELICRRGWRRLRGIYGRRPMLVGRVLPADNAEVKVA